MQKDHVIACGHVTHASTTQAEPFLPAPNGPLSTAVRRILTRPAPRNQLAGISASARDSDPYGLDLQLRAELERAFLAGVRHDVGPIEPPAGHGPRLYQQLFADLLAAADLDSAYLGYLDVVPAESLVTR